MLSDTCLLQMFEAAPHGAVIDPPAGLKDQDCAVVDEGSQVREIDVSVNPGNPMIMPFAGIVNMYSN